MGLNCSLHVNEPIMSGTLSCDKGGFNGVERFPRVNSKCPNNAMKTLLVYLLITTQPRFSKLFQHPSMWLSQYRKLTGTCPATWRWEPAVCVMVLLEALNMVFLIMFHFYFQSALSGSNSSLDVCEELWVLITQMLQNISSAYVSLTQFWSGMTAHLM